MCKQSRLLATVIVIGLMWAGRLSAQGPDSLWHRTHGGSSAEHGYSVYPVSGGGFVFAGWTQSFGAGGDDIYLVRTDANGDSLLQRAYGGGDTEFGRSVRQTSDGGFIIAGSTKSFGGGDFDVYLVKTDVQGDTSWTRCHGLIEGDDHGYSVRQAADGGYFIAGSTYSFGQGDSDGYLVRTDSQGNMLWDHNYGSAGNDYFEWMEIDTDGGCILVGATYVATPPGWEIWVVRTKASGDTLWSRTFGGTMTDYGHAGIQTDDGGFVAVGTVETAAMGYQAHLIKLHSDGSLDWRRYYGGTDSDLGYCVKQILPDQGYIISGFTESYGAGDWDVYLIRTYADGDTMWTATYGDSLREWGREIHELADGGYVIGGTTRSYGAGSDDMYLIRTRPDGAGVVKEGLLIANSPDISAWPNPAAGAVVIEYMLGAACDVRLAVYDILGREVRLLENRPIGSGKHSLLWDCKDSRGLSVGPGIYFCKIRAAHGTATTKFTKLR
jgi:hypothetical protein